MAAASAPSTAMEPPMKTLSTHLPSKLAIQTTDRDEGQRRLEDSWLSTTGQELVVAKNKQGVMMEYKRQYWFKICLCRLLCEGHINKD